MSDRKSGSYRYTTTVKGANALEQIRRQEQALQDKAERLLMDVRYQIGTDAYYTWLDEIYPESDLMEWGKLAQLAQTKLDELASAECAHVLPEQACDVCAPHTTDEIPY